MAQTDNLTIPLPPRLNVATQLAVITRFVAALCWSAVLAVLGIVTSGVLLLLVVPIIVGAVAFWAARSVR